VRGLAPFAWRSLAARPARTLLTIVGIGLGVAVLGAALVTTAGIDDAVDRTVTDVAGRADLTVSAFEDTGLSAASVAAAAEIEGVEVAAPSIERRTYLAPSMTGEGTDAPVAVLGIDPVLDPRVRDLAVIRGAGLARQDEPSALISETLAATTGLDVGDEIELYGAADAPADAGRLRIVGILRGDGPLTGAAGRVVVVPVGRAALIFSMTGVTRIDLVLRPQASLAAIETALPDAIAEPYVRSTPADLAASLQASTEEFRATMALVAAIALFSGAFLIFNTLSMTVTERVRDVGLLRAAGATRGQVTRVVLLGALLLGVAGSLLGLAMGIALASILGTFVHGAFGLRTTLQTPPEGLLLVLAIGLLVTLAAAIEPALRAGRISPVEALRARAQPGVEGRARLRWLTVVAIVVAAAGMLLWPRGTDEIGNVRPLVVYGLLLLVALASPFLIGPLGRIAGLPFALLFGVEERLARGALARDRSRTALTVGALTVGLALVVAIGTVALDARRSATAWIDGVVPGDVVLTTVTPVSLGDDGPMPEIAAVAGVERVSPLASFPVAYRGLRLDASAVSGADMAADGRLTFVAGDRTTALAALDAGGSVVLPRAQADRLGLGVGDVMSVAGGDGASGELTVAGIVERGPPGRGGEAILVGWPDAGERFGVVGADALAVRYAPGASGSAGPAVDELATSLGLQPVPLESLEGAITDALDRVFGLFDALALVAVVVAALGIVNTLTMDVVERVREIGILRAVGMTRRQVGRMVVVEAGILGVVGALLGIVAGLGAAVVMLALATGQVGPAFAVPWPTLALALLLGVGLAMLAAYYPARLAGRLSIIRAVQAE
jgi:putative ABC transport system permease protein